MTALQRTGGFVLLGLAVFAGLAGVSERVAPVYPEMKSLWEAVERRGGEANALFIGNSHSRALDAGALGVRALPLWRGGGDLFEAIYLARRAHRHVPGLRYVFIPASFPVLEMDNAAATKEDLSGRRVELYARVPGPPLAGDAESFVRGRVARVVRPDHWKHVLRPVPRAGSDDDGEQRRAIDLAAHAAMRVERAERRTGDMNAGHPGLPAAVARELDRFVREMAESQVRVVLYTPPFHPAYTARYDTAAANRVRRIMRELDARHPNAVYVDASRDTAITRKDDYFLNSDHLNAAGAEAFSALLRRRLEMDGD